MKPTRTKTIIEVMTLRRQGLDGAAISARLKLTPVYVNMLLRNGETIRNQVRALRAEGREVPEDYAMIADSQLAQKGE